MRRCIELVLAALALAPACSTDHGALARRPPSNDAGEGGMAGAAATGASGGTAGSAARGGSSGTAGTGGVKVVEPPGRAVVTFLNGVVDVQELSFCFARDDDDGPRFVGEPAPQAGLSYGAAMSLESVPGVPLTELTRVFVLSGDLDLVEGLDCAEAVERARDEMSAVGLALAQLGAGGDGGGGSSGGVANGNAGAGGEGGAASGNAGAGGAQSGGEAGVPSAGSAGNAGDGHAGTGPTGEPPRLRVSELPSLPAGALDDGYSLLYAAHGCVGALDLSEESGPLVCGPTYTAKTPTAGADLVTLSRKVDFLKLSLQALHASQALGTLDMRTVPPEGSSMIALSLGSGMTRGGLQPRSPRADQRVEDYGIASDGGVALLRAGVVIWTGPWEDVTTLSGITPVNGRVYTLVVLGPAVDTKPWHAWNPIAVTLVDNDPMLQ